MEESDYLRILQENPDNDRVRAEYYEWLARNHHSRSEFVRLETRRAEIEQQLADLDLEIEGHPIRADQEWLDTVFPLYVRSPAVGRSHSKPRPNAQPYVAVGTVVKPDTVVCVIEAHSIFNEIVAGLSGTIAQCLMEDGAMVEWEQRLFKLKRPPLPTP
jgi:biotin carboxyl carrier protein